MCILASFGILNVLYITRFKPFLLFVVLLYSIKSFTRTPTRSSHCHALLDPLQVDYRLSSGDVDAELKSENQGDKSSVEKEKGNAAISVRSFDFGAEFVGTKVGIDAVG